MAQASLKSGQGGLLFKSPYDRAMLAAFKASVPPTARRWVPDQKVWMVDPQYAQTCADLVRQYFGQTIRVPQFRPPEPENRIITLEYLGRPKSRGGADITAMGYANGAWSIVFSLAVLKRWFTGDDSSRPGESNSLYAALSIKASADASDIKRAYRRMAKQWHPDVCREPDAAEQFRKIQNAYEVLSDDRMRRKYDAGLKMLAGSPNPVQQVSDFVPPLRCGHVLAAGVESAGRFVVSEILQWQDITRAGLTMTSYWPRGGDMFVVEWV